MIYNALFQGRARSIIDNSEIPIIDWLCPAITGKNFVDLSDSDVASVCKKIIERDFGISDTRKETPTLRSIDTQFWCSSRSPLILDVEGLFLQPQLIPKAVSRISLFRKILGPDIKIGTFDNWLWPTPGGSNETWAAHNRIMTPDIKSKLDSVKPIVDQLDCIAYCAYLLGPDWVKRDFDCAFTMTKLFQQVYPKTETIAYIMPRWNGVGQGFAYEQGLIRPQTARHYAEDLARYTGSSIAFWGNYDEFLAVYGGFYSGMWNQYAK